MLPIAIEANAVRIGERLTVRFERTLRVPDDGHVYPLPPGLGHLQVERVADHADRVPAGWRDAGGVFISLYQAEAVWLSFEAAVWKPNAVTVGVGRVNAVSGGVWPASLTRTPQNYLVCPPQLWLDGINAGDGHVRQFVAMPLGRGVTVEGQLTGVEAHGGLQLGVYDPVAGRFPDKPPARPARGPLQFARAHASASPMGIAPGGRIEQKVLADEYPPETWDTSESATLLVHVLNSAQFAAVTGRPAPPSPVDAHTYTEHGFPWFRLYEEAGHVPPAEAFAALTSLAASGESGVADVATPIDVSPSQVVGLKRRGARRRHKGA